jgi:hypothetical protein
MVRSLVPWQLASPVRWRRPRRGPCPTPPVIYLGPPAAAAEPLVEAFEYANCKLMRLTRAQRDRALNAMANLMDATLNFLAGDSDEGAFIAAHSAFYRKVQAIQAGGDRPNPRHGPARRLPKSRRVLDWPEATARQPGASTETEAEKPRPASAQLGKRDHVE